MTTRDILRAAMVDAGILAAGEAIQAADAVDCLAKLNRILDNWNAERAAVYVDAVSTFTITPDLNPHTIGATGATWTATQRPVSIDSANLIQAGSDVRIPLGIIDAEAYDGISAPELSSGIPTVIHYKPTWPNGLVYFWPVPSEAHEVELRSRIVLAELSLNTTVTLPPGYRDAIILTLAEDIAPMFGQVIPQHIPDRAQRARGRAFANNDQPRRISTLDAGMPGGSSGGHFDWRTGS